MCSSACLRLVWLQNFCVAYRIIADKLGTVAGATTAAAAILTAADEKSIYFHDANDRWYISSSVGGRHCSHSVALTVENAKRDISTPLTIYTLTLTQRTSHTPITSTFPCYASDVA